MRSASAPKSSAEGFLASPEKENLAPPLGVPLTTMQTPSPSRDHPTDGGLAV